MKIYLIIFFTLFYFRIFINAQSIDKEKRVVITDSTLILGILTESYEVGELNVTDCYLHNTQFLEEGSKVIICGAKRCKNINSELESDYYEIVYKEKSYFINSNKILIKNYRFEDILDSDDKTQNKLKEFAISYSKILDLVLVEQAIKNLKNFKKFGLGIYEWELYKASEYTEGLGVNIKVYNPTNKTIKYIWFSFIGFNPVNDKVIDYVSGKSIITKKAVGPILQDEFATYNFDYVWFSDLVETAKIYFIKVQYMDGTTITIKNPAAIILKSDDKKMLDDYYDN